MMVCPVCVEEKFASDGERTSLLSDPSILEILSSTIVDKHEERRRYVLQHLMEIEEGVVSCWMCNECLRALERRMLPKLAMANNL